MDWNAIYETYQQWLLRGCCIALAVSLFVLVAIPAFIILWKEIRRWMSLGAIGVVLTGVFVCGFTQYGSTKRWFVYYSGGLKASATANVVTNDAVSIYWQRDTSQGIYVPETAAVYIDYRPLTATNEQWGLLAQSTVGAWGWSGSVQNATNYGYSVWAYYIPPEPVHTNGVWTYGTHYSRNIDVAIPLRARVEVNGKAIATPKEVRKDEEQDN